MLRDINTYYEEKIIINYSVFIDDRMRTKQ